MLGREDELKAPRVAREPGHGLLRGVRGVVVEHDADAGLGRVVLVEVPEEFDELGASAPVFDDAMYDSGEEVDAGEQRDRAVPCRRYS